MQTQNPESQHPDPATRLAALAEVFARCAAGAALTCAIAACGGGDGSSAPAPAPAPPAEAPAPVPPPGPAPAPTPAAPVITVQPTAASVVVPAAATFSVTATGEVALGYQWLKNGAPIAGATAASYTTPATALTDDGALYSVVVSAGSSSTTSAAVRLSVLAAASAWTGVRQDAAPYPRPADGSSLNGASSNIRAAALDSGGNVLLVGTTVGSYDAATTNRGYGTHLVKYGADGVLQWGRLVHPQNTGNGNAVVADAANNVYVLGEIDGAFPGQTTQGSGADIFLAKYAPDGSFLWLRQFGNPGTDIARGMAIDRSGNLIITGSAAGHLVIDGQANDLGNFVAKFDANGTCLWLQPTNFAAFPQSGPSGVAVDDNGDVFVVNAYLAKFAGDGTPRWNVALAPTFSSASSLTLTTRSVTVSANGQTLYVGGQSNLDIDVLRSTGSTAGGAGSYTARFDGAGVLQWVGMVKPLSSTGSAVAVAAINGVSTDAAGGALYFASANGPGRIDAGGAVSWFKPGQAQAYGAMPDGAGGLFVAGTLQNGPLNFGTPGVASTTFESWFVEKLATGDGSAY